jgi:hypothetical protein
MDQTGMGEDDLPVFFRQRTHGVSGVIWLVMQASIAGY